MVEYDLISGKGYLSKDFFKSNNKSIKRELGKNLCDFI